MNPKNVWAVHGLAHIYEMQQRIKKGSEFMYDRRTTWKKTFLENHCAWHWILFIFD